MNKTLLSVSIILLCTFTTVLAGDFANLRFIGFSEDGNYLAFEEWGEEDGFGRWYSNTYFINVAKNSFAAKPLKLRNEKETNSLDHLRKKGQRLSAKNLQRFGILPGNTGALLLSHLLTDQTFDDLMGTEHYPTTIKFNSFSNPNGSNEMAFYELNLEYIEDQNTECQERNGTNPNRFSLTLNFKTFDHHGEYSQILQKDSFLPVSRNCPSIYSVESIYFYDDMITVFLNVYSRGFEGPNMRYLAVTAELDYQPTRLFEIRNNKTYVSRD